MATEVVSLLAKLSTLIGQPTDSGAWLTSVDMLGYVFSSAIGSETTLPLTKTASGVWLYSGSLSGTDDPRPMCFRFSDQSVPFTEPDGTKSYQAYEFGPAIHCTDGNPAGSTISVLGLWINPYRAGALMLEDLAAGRAMEIAQSNRDLNMSPGQVSDFLIKRAANLRGPYGV